MEDRAWRLSLFGDEIETIHEIDALTGNKVAAFERVTVYPNSHYVTPRPTLLQAIPKIRAELKDRVEWFRANGKLLEAQRLEERATFDLEMLETTGHCAGIENYSRYPRVESREIRRPRCSNTCRKTPFCSWTKATWACRSWDVSRRLQPQDHACGTWVSAAALCRQSTSVR